ncbi:DNA repair helicase XPB [Paenibacillus tengchongensis]|uniref:DNA repair helicase XPB n=1 Tax=Paenibacillus tengchongensis TaxID=2608684 RepID=UPI00124D3326|nr:DNA repair helicase XPB [Paenibacillus tengchongensis]
MNGQGACILRRDRTVLLECAHPGFAEARRQLSGYAELLKSPPAYHTYRITPLSLWNAAASGHTAEEICASLAGLSRWAAPAGLYEEIAEIMSRYGSLELCTCPGDPALMLLRAFGDSLPMPLEENAALTGLGLRRAGPREWLLPAAGRGLLKQELTRLGYPVLDRAGYRAGQTLSVAWSGGGFRLRGYQREAAGAFETGGGSGVVVLPCGAGKTIVGIAVLERLQCETLILTSSATSVGQWREELLRRTRLPEALIGEYTGEKREVRPVTVATYQMLTRRACKDGPFLHMSLFNERNWGLIVYDEVHLLPAPVFRATADIQATRRLGLTATLVREDGREDDVFSLVGPKCYELPWRQLEQEGYIAAVECVELTVPMNERLRSEYAYAGSREQFRLAAVNPDKAEAARRIVEVHSASPVLVIGQYLDQLEQLADALQAPLVTGKTPQRERSELYEAFNGGALRVLVVSKVANFALNLPDAAVAIEVSGAYGSRQEEAQRLGRILRPKPGDNKAYFYTLVSEDSREQDFALRRRLFLTEQGYEYAVRTAHSLMKGDQ